MPRDGISMEERNAEGGKGCVADGWFCFGCDHCNDESDNEPADDQDHGTIQDDS